jgi:hypothetical protein
MSSTIRIKRSTVSSAPATLQNAELAYSEGGGGTLWVGVGTGGAGGSATSVQAIGGPAYISSQLSSYVTSSSLSSTLGSYVTSSSLSTTLSSYATTSAVNTAISNVINAAPAALDTLKELADALGSDASFSTTVTTSLSGKLTTANNLSELTATASTARTNLGLGTMATQSSSNVAITGGTIDGITLDGGTFGV